jgi:hypothetical protein
MSEGDEGHFSAQLLDGERVVWTGAPYKGLRLTPRDGLLIPFSLLWGGFAIFWESNVVRKGAPVFFMLWGVPFILMALFVIAGRFVVDAWLRNCTRYALTNQRILIARSGPFPKFTTLNLDSMSTVQFTPEANGRGTLRFGPQLPMWGMNGFGAWVPAMDPVPQFLAVDGGEGLFRQIQLEIRRQSQRESR